MMEKQKYIKLTLDRVMEKIDYEHCHADQQH